MKDMKKWYKRIIGKTGLDLLLNRKALAKYLDEQSYGDGQTKIMRFFMTDMKTNKDCVVEIKICE